MTDSIYIYLLSIEAVILIWECHWKWECFYTFSWNVGFPIVLDHNIFPIYIKRTHMKRIELNHPTSYTIHIFSHLFIIYFCTRIWNRKVSSITFRGFVSSIFFRSLSDSFCKDLNSIILFLSELYCGFLLVNPPVHFKSKTIFMKNHVDGKIRILVNLTL